jgi:hypothetical protein
MPLWCHDNAALVHTQCRFGAMIMLLWLRHNAASVLDNAALVQTQCRFGAMIMLLWFRHNAALMP